MMKAIFYAPTTVLLTALALNSAQAGEWSGRSSLMLGNKNLDSKDWSEQDEHGALGFVNDFRKKDWPVSIAVDLFGTGDEKTMNGNNQEAYTAEAHLGIRKTFDLPIPDCRLHPYVGAGVALVHAEQKTSANGATSRDEDNGIGGWVGVGANFMVNPKFSLGVDVRYSEADVDLHNEKREAGGVIAGLSAGYHW